jgi:hypothetical protein
MCRRRGSGQTAPVGLPGVVRTMTLTLPEERRSCRCYFCLYWKYEFVCESVT